MITDRKLSPVQAILAVIGALALLLVSACGSRTSGHDVQSESATSNPVDTQDSASTLPQDGKPRLPAPPQDALLGFVYINTTDSREWIFDGRQWVPHDDSVDAYYRQLQAGTGQSMQTKALPAALASSASVSIGAHGTHILAGYQCVVCHNLRDFATIVSFDPNGPGVSQGLPAPGFDPAAKTCSNVYCHGTYAGTFSYFFPGGDGVPELKTVPYGSNSGSTPSWYVAGLGCNGCHGNPPRPAGATPVWHSGSHGGGNDCQLCHPDATGTGGTGTAITNPSLHVNSAVNVQAAFTGTCFGCH